MKDETVSLTRAHLVKIFKKDTGIVSRHTKNKNKYLNKYPYFLLLLATISYIQAFSSSIITNKAL